MNCFKITTSKPGQEIKRTLLKARGKLENFFGFKMGYPNIIFISSRKQFNEVFGGKTELWMSGFADGNSIYIFEKYHYIRASTFIPP